MQNIGNEIVYKEEMLLMIRLEMLMLIKGNDQNTNEKEKMWKMDEKDKWLELKLLGKKSFLR